MQHGIKSTHNWYRRFGIIIFNLVVISTVVLPHTAYAQTPPVITVPYYTATVVRVENGTQENDNWMQTIAVELRDGPQNGEEVTLEYLGATDSPGSQGFTVGQTVIVTSAEIGGATQYYIVDRYRLPALGTLLAFFVILIVLFARKRGAFSLLGLLFSVVMIAYFIVPRIVQGSNPLLISSIGAVVIAVVSITVAHGISKRTMLALGSTLITIVLAFGLAVFSVWLSHMTGLSSEEAYFVQTGLPTTVDLQGLLLGGIIIGVLGILDDITTAQTAAVEEIHKANRTFGFRELYRRAFSVGKEHITSLVNTLVLAYAGASLPLFLLFTLRLQPWWVTLNSEFIAEEIIRTLVGSMTLTLAVPITTALAAYIYTKKPSL